jgi:HAD domain in Swiss Army Knife RNA repair proteins
MATSRSSGTTTTGLRVIFLDIDGVLLPFPTTRNDRPQSLFPRSTLEAFRRLLQATNHPLDCKVVLSSTWRVRDDFVRDIVDALRDFGIPMAAEDEDFFYDITDPKLHSERQWEIRDWMQKKGQNDVSSSSSALPVEAWLALDDEDLLDGDVNERYRDMFRGHVIKTKSSEGLTMQDVDDAIQLWEAQLQLVGKTQSLR